MENKDQQHWEAVYASKKSHEVSWTQAIPQTSLDFITAFDLPKTASIIDVGGGDSTLVDCLLGLGYENITVLDISHKALERAKLRLGKAADKVKWVVSDIREFHPTAHYDMWHDRATFHFLTTPNEVATYLQIAEEAVNGFMMIGTFSETGPEKCSGLHVKQYSENQLESTLAIGFDKIKCIREIHTTPFQTTQNFLFCSFLRKRKAA